MSRESDIIEGVKAKAQRDSRRNYAWFSDMEAVNEPLECVLLLGRLNEAISTMSALQDSYYTDYIWNASNSLSEKLKQEGFEEDWFYEVERKLSDLRVMLMGDSLNWDELYKNLYDSMLGHEVYWKEFYEERCKKLEAELKKRGAKE